MSYEELFDWGPLDGTRLAADVAATVPEANRRVRMEAWREDLRARVRARLGR